MKKFVAALLTIVLVAACSPAAFAGWVPTRNIELVIPFAAGGGSDVFARTLVATIEANNLSPVSIIPINMPGASGVIGWNAIATAGNNPYKIATTSSSFFTQPLTGNAPFTWDDFAFVSHLVQDPNMLVVYPGLGFETFADMVEYARANPGRLVFGGTSVMGNDAMMCYVLEAELGVEFTFVPFASGGELLVALLGGHIHLGAMGPSVAGDHLELGNVIPLAVSADSRLPHLPDLPTLVDLGVNKTHQQSRGIVANVAVDQEVLRWYSELFRRASETPEWIAFADAEGMTINFMDYREYRIFHELYSENYVSFVELVAGRE